jgi:hypothetical protein
MLPLSQAVKLACEHTFVHGICVFLRSCFSVNVSCAPYRSQSHPLGPMYSNAYTRAVFFETSMTKSSCRLTHLLQLRYTGLQSLRSYHVSLCIITLSSPALLGEPHTSLQSRDRTRAPRGALHFFYPKNFFTPFLYSRTTTIST